MSTAAQIAEVFQHVLPASPVPSPRRNPYEAARSHAIRRLLELVVPNAIRMCPTPADFEAAAELIRDVGTIFNDLVAAVGSEVEDNCPYSIDARNFDGAFADAVSDAVGTCEGIAERMIDDRGAR